MTFADRLNELKKAATPGEWQALPEECDKPYIRIRGTVVGGRYKITNVLTPAYDGVHEREAKETRANAAIICFLANNADAILELVRAAEEMANPSGYRDYVASHNDLRDALAKLNGEQT